ncbi:MAG: hypothetical protein HYZ75_02835 [Elusimicrobia bacterium]|nr:hypothetical protein [Elusimicrobiota bacterium]
MRSLLALAVLLASRPAAAYDFIEFREPLTLEFIQGGAALTGADDRLYWLDDRKGALQVLAADGRPLTTIGQGELSNPQGLALGPAGEVYVADTGNSRVAVFAQDGKLLRVIGEKGSDPGRLSKPRSVAVGLDGRVWVSDTGNDRVQAFTSEGVFLFGFGASGKENGQFKKPGRIAVDAMDNVYVLDEGNERVQKFDARTKHVKNFQLHGSDFALDEYGFLYMIDPGRGKVKEVGPDGIVLGGFGTEGKAKGQFRKAGGIGVDDRGVLLIADVGNKRLQRVALQNKLKTERVRMNVETKLLVAGPTRVIPVIAGALASAGGELFAWIPKSRQVAVFKGGQETRRIGGTESKGESSIRSAAGIVVSPKWGLFVSDDSGDKILSFGLDGMHKSNFGAAEGFFASKKKEGRVKGAAGMAVNEKGSVYVAETGNRRVSVFGPDGSFLTSFGPMVGPYELQKPVAVAWDEAGFIYVLDAGLKKVLKCEPSGGYLKSWGEEGDGVAQFDEPVSLAYDGRSWLYVLDRGRKRVAVFDREGRWVTNFFSGGQGERSLGEPTDLAVSGSELMISDPGRQRVAAFALKPRLAPPPAISTKTFDGEIVLDWEPSADPWASKYRVLRATQPGGPWAALGVSPKPTFKDAAVEAYKSYWYKAAVEAANGDVGPASRSVEVFVPGSFNVAPVEISTVTLGNIFASKYKWYQSNPVGKVVIQNNLNVAFEKVKISFRLKDFMDFATEKTVERLAAKEKAEFPLVATLNNKILNISEDTPIQAEVTLTYFEKGQKRDVSLALPLRLYSYRAITWEDPRRIANFVTVNDRPVKKFAADVLRDPLPAPKGTALLPVNVIKAMRLWSALGAVGMRFLASANNPYEKLSEDPAFPVDYSQFPRDTFEYKSGECDDLSVLMVSLLENAPVKSVLLDYPGHMAMMFDTGARDAFEAGLPEEWLVAYQGTMWLPIEMTMVGQPFEDAVRKAAFAYKEMSAAGKASIIDQSEAAKVYEPPTLPNEDRAVVPDPDAGDLKRRFDSAAQELVAARYKSQSAILKAQLDADGETSARLNLVGMVEAQHGRKGDAEKAFKRVLEFDRGHAGALNNLGGLALQAGRYGEALDYIKRAAVADPEDAGIVMNLARVTLKLGDEMQALALAEKAVALDNTFKETKSDLFAKKGAVEP